MQGWLSVLSRKRTRSHILFAYRELQAMLRFICQMPILPFDEPAQLFFEDLRAQRVRLATMDLRIACIALATGSVLLTRNLRDFRRVPELVGLVVEDWTR